MPQVLNFPAVIALGVTVIWSGEIIDTLVEYVQIETKTDDVSMTEF